MNKAIRFDICLEGVAEVPIQEGDSPSTDLVRSKSLSRHYPGVDGERYEDVEEKLLLLVNLCRGLAKALGIMINFPAVIHLDDITTTEKTV